MLQPLRRAARKARHAAAAGVRTAACLLAGVLWFRAVDASAHSAAPIADANAARNLAPAEARQKIEALRTEIAHHDALYHQKAAPEISDYDYDQLKIRLRELEKIFPAAAGAVPPVAEVG